MKIDDLALASGFSEKDVAQLRPMMERMVSLVRAENNIAKPDADGWIPWAGGECPITEAKAGEYELKFREIQDEALIKRACSKNDADEWAWSDNNFMTDITAYRLIKR